MEDLSSIPRESQMWCAYLGSPELGRLGQADTWGLQASQPSLFGELEVSERHHYLRGASTEDRKQVVLMHLHKQKEVAKCVMVLCSWLTSITQFDNFVIGLLADVFATRSKVAFTPPGLADCP